MVFKKEEEWGRELERLVEGGEWLLKDGPSFPA